MKYFKVLNDLGENRWFLGKFSFEESSSLWDFITSRKKENLNVNPILEIREEGQRLNFTFADFEVPIIDHKVKSLISENEAQFFPISFRNNPSLSKCYFLMNILNEVDCLDENFSEFDKFTIDDEVRPDLAGKYKSINKMVLKRDKIPKFGIFRLGKYSVAVIVNESIKNAFEKNGITGIKFRLIETS